MIDPNRKRALKSWKVIGFCTFAALAGALFGFDIVSGPSHPPPHPAGQARSFNLEDIPNRICSRHEDRPCNFSDCS